MAVHQTNVECEINRDDRKKDEEEKTCRETSMIHHVENNESIRVIVNDDVDDDDEYEEVEVTIDEDDDEYEEVEDEVIFDHRHECSHQVKIDETSSIEVSSGDTGAIVEAPDSTSNALSNIFSSLEAVEDAFECEMSNSADGAVKQEQMTTDNNVPVNDAKSSVKVEGEEMITEREIKQEEEENNFFTTEGGRGSEQQWSSQQCDQCDINRYNSCSSTTSKSSDTKYQSLFKCEKIINQINERRDERETKQFCMEYPVSSSIININQQQCTQTDTIQINSESNDHPCTVSFVNINTDTHVLGANVIDDRRFRLERLCEGEKSSCKLFKQHSSVNEEQLSRERAKKTNYYYTISYKMVTQIIEMTMESVSASLVNLILLIIASSMPLISLIIFAAASSFIKNIFSSCWHQCIQLIDLADVTCFPSLFITHTLCVTLISLTCFFFLLILSFNILTHNSKLHMSLSIATDTNYSFSFIEISKLALSFIFNNVLQVTSITFSSSSSSVVRETFTSKSPRHSHYLVSSYNNDEEINTNEVDTSSSTSSSLLSSQKSTTVNHNNDKSTDSEHLMSTWLPFQFCLAHDTWIPLLTFNYRQNASSTHQLSQG